MVYDPADGTRWPGVCNIQAFHGQYIRQNLLRVDGNSQTANGRQGRNDRTEVLECAIDTGNNRQHFYPGYQAQNDLLGRFGVAIRQRGYVIGSTLNLVSRSYSCHQSLLMFHGCILLTLAFLLVGGDGPPVGDDVPSNWGNLPQVGNGNSRESGSFTPGGAPWTNPNGYQRL
jgi:hypothetical protein